MSQRISLADAACPLVHSINHHLQFYTDTQTRMALLVFYKYFNTSAVYLKCIVTLMCTQMQLAAIVVFFLPRSCLCFGFCFWRLNWVMSRSKPED